eukprot:403358569
MSRGQTQVSWIDQQQQLDSSLGNSSANSIIGRDSPDAKRSKTKAQQSKKFKVSRLMRYSSNDWETDQTFIRELLRYNQLYHHDYNPILDSKQSKIIFNKVLNIDVPKNKTDYDRRFLVKAPDSSLFLQINKSQSQNSRMKPQQVEPTNLTNTNLNFNSSRMDFCAPEGVSLDLYYQKGNKRRTKSQLQKISETNPQDIYDKFTRDYSTDTHAMEHFDIKKQLEHKIKMKESLKLFEKKLFPKSSIYVVNNNFQERQQNEDSNSSTQRKAESIIEIEKQYKEWLQKEKQQNEKQKQEKLKEIQEQRQSMTASRQQSAAGQNVTSQHRQGRVKQATALRLFSKDLQKINDQIKQNQEKNDQQVDEFSETDQLNQQITIQFTNQNDQTKSSTRAQTQHQKSQKNRHSNLQIQNNKIYEINNSQSNDILIFQTQPPEISILEENSQFLYDKTPPFYSQEEEDMQKFNENQEQKNVDNQIIDEFKQKQMQRKNMQKEILNQLLNQSQADSFLNTQESINEQQYRTQNNKKLPNHIKHVSTSRLNKSSDGFRINKTSKNNINRRSLITDRLSLKSAIDSQKQQNNNSNNPRFNRYQQESKANLEDMDHYSNNIDNNIATKHQQYLSFQYNDNQKEGQTKLDVNNQESENNRNDQNSSNFSRQQMRIPYEKPYSKHQNSKSLLITKNFNNTKQSINQILSFCETSFDNTDTKHDLQRIEKLRKLEKSNQSMIKALKSFDEQNDYDMNLSKNDQSSLLLQNKLHLHNRNKSYGGGSTAQVQNVQDVLEQKKIDKLCNYENFFSQNVLKKFKDDNVKMASFIKQTQGFNKNKIWKPDKLVISKKSQVDETSFV